MNIINSARPRQKSMPSMRFADAAMFPPSPISSIAPDSQSFILSDGENATVRGPASGLVVKALRLAAIAARVRTRTEQHKSTQFAGQNRRARAFELSLRLLAYGNPDPNFC